MSLLYKNLDKISDYGNFALAIFVPLCVIKYDDGTIQSNIELFKRSFGGVLSDNIEDLKSIYPEEINIDQKIKYYMGQSSYYTFILKSGQSVPGSYAKAHQGLLNMKKYIGDINNLFESKTKKNLFFVKDCYQSHLSLSLSIEHLKYIINSGVEKSDSKCVNDFLDILYTYQKKFLIVEEANQSNDDIFDSIYKRVVVMKKLIDDGCDLFSKKKYQDVLYILDAFSIQNSTFLEVSEEISPN